MIHAYMLPPKLQQHITESYVSSPPALTITDERGNVWALGNEYLRQSDAPNGEFAFNILCNGIEMGEYASRIERRSGKMRIFTRQGWKVWTGRAFL